MRVNGKMARFEVQSGSCRVTALPYSKEEVVTLSQKVRILFD